MMAADGVVDSTRNRLYSLVLTITCSGAITESDLQSRVGLYVSPTTRNLFRAYTKLVSRLIRQQSCLIPASEKGVSSPIRVRVDFCFDH